MPESPKRDVAVWIAVAVLVAVVVVWATVGASMMGPWTIPIAGRWMHPTWGGGGMGWLGSIIGLLVLIGIAAVVARLLQSEAAGRRHDDAALRVARERYARGEITHEQFAQIRADLEASAPERMDRDER